MKSFFTNALLLLMIFPAIITLVVTGSALVSGETKQREERAKENALRIQTVTVEEPSGHVEEPLLLDGKPIEKGFALDGKVYALPVSLAEINKDFDCNVLSRNIGSEAGKKDTFMAYVYINGIGYLRLKGYCEEGDIKDYANYICEEAEVKMQSLEYVKAPEIILVGMEEKK